ncbi:MAG: DNA primase [Bacteroidaceae bacterium]|nr:DNA primase [Bacteroidaceae bacterium]
MIDRITTDKIKEAAQIVDVVSDFVTLKKSGANYKGLCPFHDDRTPSFIVSPAKNYCKCFACGKGGNPIGFIMEHEQLSYPDALRYLAKKYGIQVEEKELTAEERAAQTERESMFILNEWALKWFKEQMHETQDGRAIGLAYFRERGFRDDIIEKFQLGFCPKSRDTMSQAAQKEGYKEQFLVGTGLSIKREDGSVVDRFWGRVMFPWHTVGGKVAGFGGRVLDAATKGVAVKYQNSPESSIYSKRRELYGLFQAKQSIVKMDQVYMVEGYTDVISMHQCGIENVVANSGTALTREQIHLLHRFTNNITLLYDGDEAGIHAAQRGTDMLLAAGMNVKILLLPDGDDPDSFARKHNAEDFRKYVEEHQVDFLRFKTNLALAESQNDPRKLSALVAEIVTSISFIPDEITRSIYIRETAQTMRMDEKMIVRAVQNQMSKNREEEHRRKVSAMNTGSATMSGEVGRANKEPVSGEQEAVETASGDDRGASAEQVITSNAVTTNLSTRRTTPIEAAELLLAQLIVRYGEQLICEAEDEDGKMIPLNVTEFIFYSLTQDGLTFTHPTAQVIMNKAMEHIHDDGFVAEKYFLGHQDRQLSEVAFQLSVDKEELSKYHIKQKQMTDDRERLMELTTHVLADMKLQVVKKEIVTIMSQLKDPMLPKEKQRELLEKFKEMKEAQTRLAKDCGDRVLR